MICEPNVSKPSRATMFVVLQPLPENLGDNGVPTH